MKRVTFSSSCISQATGAPADPYETSAENQNEETAKANKDTRPFDNPPPIKPNGAKGWSINNSEAITSVHYPTDSSA